MGFRTYQAWHDTAAERSVVSTGTTNLWSVVPGSGRGLAGGGIAEALSLPIRLGGEAVTVRAALEWPPEKLRHSGANNSETKGCSTVWL